MKHKITTVLQNNGRNLFDSRVIVLHICIFNPPCFHIIAGPSLLEMNLGRNIFPPLLLSFIGVEALKLNREQTDSDFAIPKSTRQLTSMSTRHSYLLNSRLPTKQGFFIPAPSFTCDVTMLCSVQQCFTCAYMYQTTVSQWRCAFLLGLCA